MITCREKRKNPPIKIRQMVKKTRYPAASRNRRLRVVLSNPAVSRTSILPRWCRGARRLQHVSDAAHRVDHFIRPLLVDLAAQVADIDVDNVGETVVVHVPHMLDDHRAAERAAGVAHHVLKDAEFLRRQFEILAVAGHFAPDAIEREIPTCRRSGTGWPGRRSARTCVRKSTKA